MPLYKRKPFPLAVNPEDLQPEELVFQIGFTKEIFRSYSDYLRRMNLYRRRVWTCKASGKGNLTYEEAFISEQKASKRIQSIPSEYVAFVLREVQFSMLNLIDLVNSIFAKLQGSLIEGAELYGKQNGSLRQCRIVKILEEDQRREYEIEWLTDDPRNNAKTVVDSKELTGEDLPFSKRLLKSFIRDSTSQNLPWVLHESLAKRHAISTTPPDDLKYKFAIQNGVVNRKRKRSEGNGNSEEKSEKEIKVYRRRNAVGFDASSTVRIANEVNEHSEDQAIKYPIDDLLVQPSVDDNFLMDRPSPCRKFSIPMNYVGDLLMVWDFCASYGRLLCLSPFTLEDFESSLCYKESTPSLIVESCLALLRLLKKDGGAAEDNGRKSKIVWAESLCDFLETSCTVELSKHVTTIKLGDYSLLEVHVKLAIFRELVARSLETNSFKDKLNEYFEERQALAATRRDEALEEGRKKREEKERRKSEASGKDFQLEYREKSDEGSQASNCGLQENVNGNFGSRLNHSSRKSENGEDGRSKKNIKRHALDDDFNNPSKREIHKLMKNGIKEQIEMKSAEERKEFLDCEIEKRPIRSNALGRDRNCSRYWFFRHDGKVFVESPDFKEWGYYQTKEEIDALIGSLNIKGVRERALKKQLQKFYNKICSEMKRRWKESKKVVEMEETLVRRSTRVRAPPGVNPGSGFLRYVNKW